MSPARELTRDIGVRKLWPFMFAAMSVLAGCISYPDVDMTGVQDTQKAAREHDECVLHAVHRISGESWTHPFGIGMTSTNQERADAYTKQCLEEKGYKVK